MDVARDGDLCVRPEIAWAVTLMKWRNMVWPTIMVAKMPTASSVRRPAVRLATAGTPETIR